MKRNAILGNNFCRLNVCAAAWQPAHGRVLTFIVKGATGGTTKLEGPDEARSQTRERLKF